MKELQEFYPVICKWLPLIKSIKLRGLYYNPEKTELIVPDFIHSSDQREWIVEKLKEDGWTIQTYEEKGYYAIQISLKEYPTRGYNALNKSKAVAFLEAVKELIIKENENKKTS